MTRLSTFILRHKRLVVLFWLVVAAAGIARQPGLRAVSYASTGDRRVLPADGRTTYWPEATAAARPPSRAARL